MQTPPVISPQPQSSNRVSGHWKWIIAAVCLLALAIVIGIGGFVLMIAKLMKSSTVYTEALAKVQSSPAAAAALGAPIKDGFLFTGKISEEGSSGKANITIPVSGPKGSGHLSVYATESDGEWHFNHLTLLVNQTDQRLDLLNTNQ